ncbi:hypothetical protein N0V90_006490 [Kalmusia sp. IMI 367209]|nr:hypothetical protein N0V90_006490 [Kalmusia sp. IMI 367209]
MSAPVEEQKPVLATEAGAVEPTPAPAGVVSEEKPAEPVAPVEETPKAEGEAAAPVEEKKEEKPIEPIYSGALGYKAPGLKNAFRFSKKYFWFGEEAAVPTSSLSHYLRGEKADVAHPTAAWSSVTGKGLLYFVKHADEKSTPAGVLKLADATELSKDGLVAFHFKLHGHKHAFEAQTAPERNGWFVAVEKAIEEAKAAKEGIVANETYKEELSKLGKPATLAATTGSTPKKSTDVAPKPAEAESSTAAATTEETAAPARTGSSSSSSSDEDKKKKAAKSKSRSVSRGKRASIFGGLLGKKDKAEEKVEEKKEEKKEKSEEKKEEKEEPTVPAEPAAETSATAPVVAPVITSEVPPVEPVKAEETPAVEEKKVEEKPKPAKRGSIFGNFVEKLKSPTHEKKEADLVPAVPAKESEVAAEAPKIEEPATTETAPVIPPVDAAAVDTTTEAPKVEEPKPATTTPHKEKQSFSFGKFLGGNKEKAKSPATEKAPELPKAEEAPKVEEAPAVGAPAAVEPVAEAPKEEAKEEPATEAATTTTPVTKKRGSIFGALGGKKEGDDKARSGFGGLFRAASKAGKPKKEKEVTPAAKVDEAAEPKEEKTEAAPVAEEKKEEPAVAAAEPATIGDVVPEAVTVGQDTKSTPQVSATA